MSSGVDTWPCLLSVFQTVMRRRFPVALIGWCEIQRAIVFYLGENMLGGCLVSLWGDLNNSKGFFMARQ